MIRRLAQACFRHRLRVVLGWVIALVVLMVASGTVGTGYSSDFTLPDVESKRGIDILEDEFGGQGAGQVGQHRVPGPAGRRGPCGPRGYGALPCRSGGDPERPVRDQPLHA